MSNLTPEEESRLSTLLIAELDDWGVSNAQKIILLALPTGTRIRAIYRYQQGEPLPDNSVTREHIQHLLGIAEALRLAYPRNKQGGKLWLNRANKNFSYRTPLAVMLEDGLAGITAVRMRIDCSYDWFIDEQNAKNNTE
jgi:hypothetical protein